MAWSSRFSRIGRLGQSLTGLVDPRSGLGARDQQLGGRRQQFLSLQRNLAEARALTRTTISGLSVCLMLGPLAFGTPKRQPATDRQITIRIHDYAQSAPSVRRHAEEAAGNILKKAGVVARWVDCPVYSSSTEDCSGTGTPLDFVVNLLPYSMSERLHQQGGVLGYTPDVSGNPFGFITWVFYDVAKDRAADHQQDLGELLGDAIAHELGHLLLGTNSHSGWGLMSAFWFGNQLRLASQGWLAFSKQESERIQAALSARALAATTREEVAKTSHQTTREPFMVRVQQAEGGTE